MEVCANSLPSSLLPSLLPSFCPLSVPPSPLFSLLLPSFSRSLVHQASDVDMAETLLGPLRWALGEGLVSLCVHVCGLTMEEEAISGSS